MWALEIGDYGIMQNTEKTRLCNQPIHFRISLENNFVEEPKSGFKTVPGDLLHTRPV